MATQTQDGFGMALLKLLGRGVDATQRGVDKFAEGPASDVGAWMLGPESEFMGNVRQSIRDNPDPITKATRYWDPEIMQIEQNPSNPNGVMNQLTGRKTPMEDVVMPKGNTSFAENLPAVSPEPTPAPTQAETNPAVGQQDPLVAAILSFLGQKGEQTPAQAPVDPDKVLETYYARNPEFRPEAPPTTAGGKFWRYIQTANNYAPNQRPRNPEELAKLNAELGVASEGQAGEQQLNRGMRSTEHGARVGGQPQGKDYLNILAGKSDIQDRTNASSRLQREQAGLTKDINRANVGNQKEIIGATSAAQTSPGAVRSELAVRNPEGMTQQAFEEATGMQLTPEQWATIVNSNNKAVSPMEQVMAYLLAERFGQRSGAGRQAQGQQINTNALKQ